MSEQGRRLPPMSYGVPPPFESPYMDPPTRSRSGGPNVPRRLPDITLQRTGDSRCLPPAAERRR